ncbi:ExbD/TolR family protein [Mucilaginibacter glaciei]|uniref:Biopolymer transporter ExbD n=1 Tax=Mucilaginibacter glaciei TaxID=2772109 RepID=A0A926NZ43_9SPHI|nr:biopolymer transporter ExbD [Mucilaginibacter glaciei]MBD1394573.1 biopolymer transporter ExbD [Mucilaginibacter glaciei]
MAELTATPQKQGARIRTVKAPLRVDLTAMVDLAFLLITFFILTTTLAKPKALDLVMPVGDEPGGVSNLRTLTLCLGKNNQLLYYLGEADKPVVSATLTNYGRQGLRRAIIDMKAKVKHDTGKSMIVLIKPAQSSVYENLVNALDEMKITGVQQYAIGDITPADINLLKGKEVY